MLPRRFLALRGLVRESVVSHGTLERVSDSGPDWFGSVRPSVCAPMTRGAGFQGRCLQLLPAVSSGAPGFDGPRGW